MTQIIAIQKPCSKAHVAGKELRLLGPVSNPKFHLLGLYFSCFVFFAIFVDFSGLYFVVIVFPIFS